MNEARELVRKMTDNMLVQCIRDYDALEETGTLGVDTELRQCVNSLFHRPGDNQHLVLLYAESFMKEVYRHFAILYLERG